MLSYPQFLQQQHNKSSMGNMPLTGEKANQAIEDLLIRGQALDTHFRRNNLRSTIRAPNSPTSPLSMSHVQSLIRTLIQLNQILLSLYPSGSQFFCQVIAALTKRKLDALVYVAVLGPYPPATA